MHLLAVCLGNICRSPLAEGLLRREIERRGLNWTVDSAGTAGYHVGNPLDPRSVAEAARHGLDISGQRSRKVTVEDLAEYDVILAMDRSNFRDLQLLASTPRERARIQLLLRFTDLEDAEGPDVFDPYWDDGGFAGVYELLEVAAARAIDRLERSVEGNA